MKRVCGNRTQVTICLELGGALRMLGLRGRQLKGVGFPTGRDENVLKLTGVMALRFCEYVKNH